METAYFERFELELPSEAVTACHHPGDCLDDVKHWAPLIERPATITPEALADELRNYGDWNDAELADDNDNWLRLIWLAAGNIQDEGSVDDEE